MIKRAAISTLRLVGSAFRAALVGVLAVALIAGGVALADYSATQGTGTTFASVVIATKHYMAMVICDATVGETQCAAVNSSGQLATTGSIFGPTATGSAAANPPVLIGGTTTGGATGTVQGAAVKPASTVPLATDPALVVAISPNSVNPNGQALAANSAPVVAPVLTVGGAAVVTGGVPVVNGASTYNTIAASQSTQALTGGSGGATGDYLSQCTIVPATTAPGVVTILDNSTAIYSYPGGGTTALTTLVPFTIPVGAVSVSGAWKVTTGANVSVVCVGKFH